MRGMLAIVSAMLIVLAGCAAYSVGAINPLTGYGGAVPLIEQGCSFKAKSGECMKAWCKADSAGSCDDWAAGCLRVGAYYQGSSSGGTCSKIL